MPLSFEHYLSVAFNKWKSYAYQQQHLEAGLRQQVTNTKYTDHSTFELLHFNGKKFNIKTKLRNTPEGLWENHHVYHFNTDGLPVIDETRHVFNQVFWTSYFLYQPEETVFIAYNNAVDLPDRLSWIEWENGKKKALHFFRLQYGRDAFINASFPGFFSKARSEEGSFLIWSAEVYHYDEKKEKIVSADYISTIPGYGFYIAVRSYSYDKKGILQQIQSNDHNGRTQIEYSRPGKGETITLLIQKLSESFADAIADGLQKEAADSPIALMDLSFRSVDNYVPYINYATETDLQKFEQSALYESDEFFSGIIWMKHQLDWKYDEQTEALYTRFFKRIDDVSNWQAGRKLMYTLSVKLNQIANAKGEPLFSKHFFAYALDGELDTELDKIVIKCGASKQQVSEWKKAGKL